MSRLKFIAAAAFAALIVVPAALAGGTGGCPDGQTWSNPTGFEIGGFEVGGR